MKAKIAEKREVARGTLYVVFDLLGHEVDFKPGQYFWVTLLDPPYDDEKGPKRHISVATSPNDRGVLSLCTRLRDSAFKRSLAETSSAASIVRMREQRMRDRAKGGLLPMWATLTEIAVSVRSKSVGVPVSRWPLGRSAATGTASSRAGTLPPQR